jgi:hypothetical protein
MKVRTAITMTARRPALTVVGWAILTILVVAAVSACTSSPGSTSVYLPTASDGATSTVTTTPATPPTTPVSPTLTVTVTTTPYYSPIPTAAPVTGGGGTAGLQDSVLFIIGGAAIVFGAGSFFYRKKLSKDR